MKKIITAFILLLFSVVYISCGDEIENEGQDLLNDLAFADSLQSEVVVSEKIIDEMIYSIPSPIEMTSLILSTGSEFNEQLLNSADNLDSYESALSKAINLGVYGTNLGYLNIYGKTGLSVDYISSVRSLARDLKVDQFFDFHLLKRLASSKDNIDSLVNITTQSFSKMNVYLREQNRTKTSVLIVTGTFVEGLFLATQIVDKAPNKGLSERIGEQKISLNNLILMLEVYKADTEVTELIIDFKALKVLYDDVEIFTTYKDPITKEVDGVLVIEDQSSSEVKMSTELLQKIISKTKELRTKII